MFFPDVCITDVLVQVLAKLAKADKHLSVSLALMSTKRVSAWLHGPSSHLPACVKWVSVHLVQLPCWPSGKASASRAEGPGFESCLHRDFFKV